MLITPKRSTIVSAGELLHKPILLRCFATLMLLVLSLVVDLLGCLITSLGQSYDYNPIPPPWRRYL